MDTKDFGRAFVHFIKIKPGTPLVHRAPTVQIERPFARSRSWVIRFGPLRRAIVVGWWRPTGWTEEEALLEAVQGWGVALPGAGIDLDNEDVRAVIRDNIAECNLDPSDEWEIIQMIGVA